MISTVTMCTPAHELQDDSDYGLVSALLCSLLRHTGLLAVCTSSETGCLPTFVPVMQAV